MNVSVTCYSYVPTKWNSLKHLFPTPEKKFIGRHLHFFTFRRIENYWIMYFLRFETNSFAYTCISYLPKNLNLSKHMFLMSQKNFIDQHMPFLRLDKKEFIGTCNSYISKKFHWPTHAIPASRHFEIKRNIYFLCPEKNHWRTQAFLTFRQIGIYRNMYFLRPEKFQRPTQAILTSRRIGIYRNM